MGLCEYRVPGQAPKQQRNPSSKNKEANNENEREREKERERERELLFC